ncbi:MAG: amino acid ABC transporter permease [Thermotaleaceae bacterium]
MQLDFSMMIKYLPYLYRATLTTISVTAVSLLLGILISIPLSLIKLSRFKVLQGIGAFYTSIFRGVPLLVQVFMVYFGLPQLFPILKTLSNFQLGCITFAFNSSAYISESLRGGIQAVDIGQKEAAMALGVPYGKTIKDIIFPQAIKSVLPSLINEFIGLLKNTTLISTIGVVELLRSGQMIVSDTYRAFEPYAVISLYYYILVMILSMAGKWMERRVNISDKR